MDEGAPKTNRKETLKEWEERLRKEDPLFGRMMSTRENLDRINKECYECRKELESTGGTDEKLKSRLEILSREQNKAWFEAGIAAQKVHDRGFFNF